MSKVRKTKRELYSVVHLSPNQQAKSDWLEKSDLDHSMFAPVVWDGKPAELRFWNYRKAATNQEATDLFDRMGFTIGGSAYVVTGTALFHVLEVDQRVQEVERDLSSVFFDEPPIVRQFRTDYWRTRVYTRNEDDAFCIRLRLK